MDDKLKPTRIEIPGLTERRTVKPANHRTQLGLHRETTRSEAMQRIAMEDKLRATINPLPARTPASAPRGIVTAAEERVRMFEDMQRKKARQKMARNFLESVMLLMALVAFIGLCLWWKSHKNKVAAEEARIYAEAEAERLRLAEERDRMERQRREKDRLEREAAIARERAERERLERIERESREKSERELRDNKDRYQMYMTALKGNKFDLFGKSVTNDLATVGGELCYLLPSETTPAPLYWTVHETNGAVSVFRLDESGKKDAVSPDVFASRIRDLEYLVAKGDTVYYRSLRKSPWTGILSKTKEGDPSDVFFGSLAAMLKELKPSYDELTFDIIFIPKGSAKKIHVENLEFGCTYSFENVRDAIEKANPFNVYDAHGGGSSRAKRFKRTVKIWNGAMIKQGIDGVTYVPRTPPPERVYYPPFRSNLSGHKVIYRSRERDSYVYRDNGHSRWQDLYNRAKEEDAAEREYYERQRASRAERRSSAQTEAERKWHEKIDNIFREGTLTYHIRKAKVAK